MQSRANQLLVLLIVFAILLELSSPQNSKAKRKKTRNRSRKKPREESAERIKCIQCFVSMQHKFVYTDPCYNPYYNQTDTDTRFLTQCSPLSKYCKVDITRVNTVLTVVDRRCGPPDPPVCSHFCISNGYSIDTTICTFCCKGKVSEDDDNYDPDEHANYTCPVGPH